LGARVIAGSARIQTYLDAPRIDFGIALLQAVGCASYLTTRKPNSTLILLSLSW